jgi:rubrerythrin
MRVYVLNTIPKADKEKVETVPWESICHNKETFLYVHYDYALSARPYRVTKISHSKKSMIGIGSEELGTFKTLEKAVKAAEKYADDHTEIITYKCGQCGTRSKSGDEQAHCPGSGKALTRRKQVD